MIGIREHYLSCLVSIKLFPLPFMPNSQRGPDAGRSSAGPERSALINTDPIYLKIAILCHFQTARVSEAIKGLCVAAFGPVVKA